jgi:hypothetical protein
MAVQEKTYNTTLGSVEFIHPEITFVNLLKVKKAGKSYDIIYSGSPTDKQVLYNSSGGSLLFLIPFERDANLPTMVVTDMGETIYVLFNV